MLSRLLKTPFLHYTTFALLLTILLAGCGAQQQNKKTESTGLLGQWSKSYLKNKEIVAEQRALKQHVNQQLSTSNIKLMTYDDLIIAKKYYLELGYQDRAIKCLERMVGLTQDPTALNEIRLELADLFFDLGDFEKAGKLYVGYLEFYPGSINREYVEYKAILAHFYITLCSDRDQTETKKTVALTQSFLENGSLYAQYVQDVKEIQAKCYEKLVGSEMQVCGFYLRRGQTKAAEKRLAYINEHYRRHVPSAEGELLALETDLNQQLGKPAPEIPAHLQDNIILAENSNKRSMVERF